MQKRVRFSFWYYLIILASIIFLEYIFFSKPSVKEISYKAFRDQLAENKIQSLVITPDRIHGLFKAPDSTKAVTTKNASTNKAKFTPHRGATPWRLNLGQYKKEVAREFTVVPLEDPHLIADLQSHGVDYRGKQQSNWFSSILLNWILPFGLLALVWVLIMRRMGRGPNVLSIGKSKAKIYEDMSSERVTFDDVAGIDEAVEEIKEIVGFLKNPTDYTRLGAKLPKGILLVGPPGTGKTLLARAVAGEAGVPFFSLSGSDFVEMFVGVGAARVRDLFAEAMKVAPCIVFIDELDAIGKSRGATVVMGGNDERENTLNQLLTEMDGFDPKVGIILVAATNRPEVLDPALLRPGRFDRQILVDRPDLLGRTAIFKVHTRGLVLADDVDLKKLAAQTPGFAGAEIANISNEAALLASRKGKERVGMAEFQEAIERTIAGLEKKNKLINAYERQIVAVHESGHAIVGYFTPGADPIQKVSIVPRGLGALGFTLQTPLEDRYLMSRAELLGKIKGLLGGRAAEDVVFGEISTGASNDLEKAAKIARDMITIYGMGKQLPNVSFVEHGQPGFLGQNPWARQHSERIEQMIDQEISEIINNSYKEAKALLVQKSDKLNEMTRTLLKNEVLGEKQIIAILGVRPITPPSEQELLFENDETNHVIANHD